MMPSMCTWDTNQVNAVSTFSMLDSLFNATSSNLPSSYDGRTQSFAATVKNQSSTGGCWAFATTSALEYFTKKEYGLDYLFSTRHIEYVSTREFLNNEINGYGYNRVAGSGGNYFMSASYLANGLGPISEDEMPFSTSEEVINISEIQNKTILLDVNNLILEYGSGSGAVCSSNEIEKIKNYVYTYGSLMVTTYMTISSKYYNSSTDAFYYNGSSSINHAVLIVGWDDNYSKDNFSSSNKPSSDGAWIVQSSYGTSFGDNGYYYISYEDVHVCDIYMTVASVDQEVEDNAYIYDNLGYNTFYGFESENIQYTTAYAMNVFTKEEGKNEVLKEIAFGNSGIGSYKIYYIEGNGKENSISDMMLIGSGDMDYAGYITHVLDNPIYLSSDVTDFSIVIYYNMEDSVTPLPISSSANSLYQYITLDSNQSFVSYDGEDWYDLTSMSSYVLIASLKGFSDDTSYSIALGQPQLSINDANYNIEIPFTSENINPSNLKLILKDSSGSEIDITNITFTNDKINLSLDTDVNYGIYYITIYYNDVYLDEKEIVLGAFITSNVYSINQDNLVIYVQPNTSIHTFISNVKGISDTYITSNSISDSEYVYTGLMVDNYVIVVLGDVTGDGYAKMNDVMKISQYIVDGTGIVDYYRLLAADVNLDSMIKMNDVMKISNYIVEGGTL